MKLSVVIPVYNGEAFIQKSYFTIKGQGINDYEILYVNNNSIDDSEQEIQKLQSHDSRVVLLNQIKQGAAAARNLGIKTAKGEYIYVFDVDDEIYPNALLQMIRVLDSNSDVEAVFGKMMKSDRGISDTNKPAEGTNKVIIKNPPHWGLEWFRSLKTVVGPPAFMYRKTVFDKIGLYNEAIKNNEDTALDIKLGMTQRIAFIDRFVYLYFKHPDSTIEQAKRRMPRAFMVWPRLIKEHIPYYLEYNTPVEFKKLLFGHLFQSMGRQLVFTTGLKNRHRLKCKLLNDIYQIHVPLLIEFYLSILVILPFESIRKIYGYYLVPYVVKRVTN